MMGLFDISEKISLNGISFNELSIKDKELFGQYCLSNTHEQAMFEHNFMFLYPLSRAIKKSETLLWKEKDDWLYVFSLYNKSERLYLYVCPLNKHGEYKDLKNAYDYALKILSKVNESKISECAHMRVQDLFVFEKKNISISWQLCDFVFRSSDLINLSGKQFKSRRNMVNNFKNNNVGYIIRKYEKTDFDAVVALHNKWKKEFDEREVDNSSKVASGPELLIEILRIFDKADYRVLVAVINNKIEGIIVVSSFCKNTCSVIAEYTNTEIRGLAEFLWYDALEKNQDLGEFENDGGGGKDEKHGLYAYKESHNPVLHFQKKFVSFNKNGSKINGNVFAKGDVAQ